MPRSPPRSQCRGFCWDGCSRHLEYLAIGAGEGISTERLIKERLNEIALHGLAFWLRWEHLLEIGDDNLVQIALTRLGRTLRRTDREELALAFLARCGRKKTHLLAFEIRVIAD